MSEKNKNNKLEALASLCKRRGFIFQASEIYGGLNGFWDYGPLGAELKRNIKDAWGRAMVRERDDVRGTQVVLDLEGAPVVPVHGLQDGAQPGFAFALRVLGPAAFEGGGDGVAQQPHPLCVFRRPLDLPGIGT